MSPAYSKRGVIGPWRISSETNAGEGVTQNDAGPKTGEACSASILGIVTTGDASYMTAARNGGIRKIATVNDEFREHHR